MLSRRVLLTGALATGATGCSVVHKTDIFRKDELTDAQEVIADTQLDHGGLTITGSVDRADTTYDPGQPITLSVKTNRNAYVAILRVTAYGDTTLVFPNRGRRSAAVPANTVLTVPAPDDKVKIAADKSGVVLFEFIAATSGDAWPFTRAPDDGSDFTNLGTTTRNIAKDLEDALKPGPAHDTAATHLTVRISGRGIF
jgi:hypothetical protein